MADEEEGVSEAELTTTRLETKWMMAGLPTVEEEEERVSTLPDLELTTPV